MAIINRPKILVGEFLWEDDPTHSCYFITRFLVADETGATIPSLTVELDFRRGMIAEDCKFCFTLFAQRNNQRRRVYQIEVMPPQRCGHRDNHRVLYGSHQHFGDEAESLDSNGLGCLHHEEWFHEFCRRATINFGGFYVSPTAGVLL